MSNMGMCDTCKNKKKCAVHYCEKYIRIKEQTKKPKTNFDKITESPEALADFVMDIGCNVGHYKYPDGFPPYEEPDEMIEWLKREVQE